MEKHRELTLKRLKTFQHEIKKRLYTEGAPVNLTHFAAPGRITYQEALNGSYIPISTGVRLEPIWSTHWFKVQANTAGKLGWKGSSLVMGFYPVKPVSGRMAAPTRADRLQ